MIIRTPAVFLLVGSFSFVTHVCSVHGACSRADIEFYLSKEFTPEQITTICADDKKPLSSTDHDIVDGKVEDEKQPLVFKDSEKSQNIDLDDGNREQMAKRILPSAIDGYDVYLTNDSFHFTLKTCFEYGEEDLFGFREKVCPEVQYVISWDGLEVKKAWKEYYFLGRSQVKVKGKINRVVISGLDTVEPSERSKIDKELDQGDETVIPIRDDVSVSKVKEALMILAR